MAKKDLKYFMHTAEDEIVTVPGPDSFRDEDGKVIPFEIKVLSQKEITEINDNYHNRVIATDKKGNPLVVNGEVVWKSTRDNARASRHIIAEALQYPNLKDPELMDFYKCVDVTDMPLLVFPRSDDYAYISRIVMQALGIMTGVEDGDESDLKAAKN